MRRTILSLFLVIFAFTPLARAETLGSADKAAITAVIESQLKAFNLSTSFHGSFEPRIVTVASVELQFMTVWDADGTSFIVPAYRFSNVDGGEWMIEAAAELIAG